MKQDQNKASYIKKFKKRLYRNDPENPNGIILDNGQKIDLDPESNTDMNRTKEIEDEPKNNGEAFVKWGVWPSDFHVEDCTCDFCKWAPRIQARESHIKQEVIAELRKRIKDNECYYEHNNICMDKKDFDEILDSV